MSCCDHHPGECNQGRNCPARETMLHTKDGGETVDTQDGFAFSDVICGAVWWVGTAALVVLAVAALGLAMGFTF